MMMLKKIRETLTSDFERFSTSQVNRKTGNHISQLNKSNNRRSSSARPSGGSFLRPIEEEKDSFVNRISQISR